MADERDPLVLAWLTKKLTDKGRPLAQANTEALALMSAKTSNAECYRLWAEERGDHIETPDFWDPNAFAKLSDALIKKGWKPEAATSEAYRRITSPENKVASARRAMTMRQSAKPTTAGPMTVKIAPMAPTHRPTTTTPAAASDTWRELARVGQSVEASDAPGGTVTLTRDLARSLVLAFQARRMPITLSGGGSIVGLADAGDALIAKVEGVKGGMTLIPVISGSQKGGTLARMTDARAVFA